jgi:hypothetical protein
MVASARGAAEAMRMRTEIQVTGRTLRILQGDITMVPADAVVNAAELLVDGRADAGP